jgi:hypothetical protein
VSIPNGDTDEDPFVINLAAQGLAPDADAFAETSPSRTAIADGGTFGFGTVALGSSSVQTFTVENNGNADLVIDPNIATSGSSDFQITDAPSTNVIAPGSSAQFDVTFTPTGTGSRSLTVSVSSNDPIEDPFDVNLLGSGAASAPVATTEAASNLTATGATLNGTVTPNGASTDVTFEYYETSAGPTSATPVPADESPVTGGTTGQAVSASLSGLTPGVEYTYQVLATNSEGSATGSTVTFTTGVATPTVALNAPASGDVTGTTASLSGTVDPGGASTTVEFELTPDGGSASTVPAAESPLTGAGSQSVTATATGLTAGTEYTVRLIATNTAGKSTSGDETFTTQVQTVVSGTNGTGNDTGYRMLAVPSTATQADLEDDLDFNVNAGALLHTYAGGSWNAGTSSTTLERGKGFVLYFFDDATDEVTASGIALDIPDGGENEDADVTVTGLSNAFAYQVLGNPYSVAYDLTGLAGGDLTTAGFQGSVLIWNPSLGAYETLTPGDPGAEIAAWQGFVVQRSTVGTGAEQVTFASSGRLTGSGSLIGSTEALVASADSVQADPLAKRAPSSAAKSSTTPAIVRLDLTVNGTSTWRDRLAVRFDDRSTAAWDAFDLEDTAPPVGGAYVTLTAPIDRGGRAVPRMQAAEPMGASVEVNLPVTIRPVPTTEANPSGTATIAWPQGLRDQVPADWLVELVDTQSGTRTDLRTGSATFTVQSGTTIEGRFKLAVTGGEALPVDLATLFGTPGDAGVTVQWRTLSETNNDRFIVQRQVTGGTAEAASGTWTDLGAVKGAGTTTEPTDYRFVDRTVPFGTTTLEYRLRQIDVDGTDAYSDPTTVRLQSPDAVTLKAPFPNPARAGVTVQYTLPEATTVTLEVFDLLGRRVATVADGPREAPGEEIQISTSSLAPGVYFLRLQTESRVQTQRFTVIR